MMSDFDNPVLDNRLHADDIDEQAALWFTRQHGQNLTEQQTSAFRQWIRYPQHQKAYQEILETWQMCSALPRPSIVTSSPKKRLFLPSFSFKTAIALCLFAVLIVPISHYFSWQEDSIRYVSHDEIKEVVLEDGSSLMLNKHTSIRVNYSEDKRQLWLDQGQAYFKVQANVERPFYVQAQDVQIKVVGTEFDVNMDAASRVAVAVSQGKVEVKTAENANVVYLNAGDRILKNMQSGLLRGTLPRSELVGSWRFGQLHFFEMPLRDVLIALKPYLSVQVQLDSPELGELLVSGVANVDDAREFLDSMPLLLPVSLVAQDKNKLLITRP